jgi:hypothetical protein
MRRQNLEGLDRAMSSLIMNTKIINGESRVTRQLANFYQVLEVADMQNVYDQKPKRCVRYLLSALLPPGFITYVEVQLKREKNGNLKKDWREFLEWLIERSDRYTEFEWIAGTEVPRLDKRDGRSVGESERSSWKLSDSKTPADAPRRPGVPKREQKPKCPVPCGCGGGESNAR